MKIINELINNIDVNQIVREQLKVYDNNIQRNKSLQSDIPSSTSFSAVAGRTLNKKFDGISTYTN